MYAIEFTSFVSSPHYLDTPDIYGLSPLMNACRLGNTRSVSSVLINNVTYFCFANEARACIFTGCSCIYMYVCIYILVCSITELLLDLGASTEYSNRAGKTRYV